MRLPLMFLVVTASCAPLAPPVDNPPPVIEDLECAPASDGGLTIAGIESQPGYDEELAALDLGALPERLPLNALSQFERDAAAYMLEEDVPLDVDRDRALTTSLGRAVLGAYASAGAGGADLDFGFLRRGLHRFYACDRGFPPTLDAFRAEIFDFTTSEVDQVVDSTVKDLPRRIRRIAGPGVFVAETLLPGDVVRETEIILTDRRGDDDIEFIEYDEDGLLRASSSFATSTGGQAVGAVPFSCIACHGYRDVSPPAP